MAIRCLLMRKHYSKSLSYFSFFLTPKKLAVGFSSLPTSASESAQQSPVTPKPSSLSARMSFIFDQIDQIDKQREEKDQTLQRIRSWRESKNDHQNVVPPSPETDTMENLKTELVKSEALMANSDVKKEVELVHPWAEWVELMERLVQQNYFDHKRKDEDGMMEGLGIDLSDAAATDVDEKGLQFTRDFKAVQAAMVNFGRDRFDILRSLSRHDLQVLVGYGCPSADKKVAFSSKLLRKLVHLDEGDVCSSCSFRSSCEKAYLLTNKEEEAQTIDVMRVLLAYGFDVIDGSESTKSLSKMKSIKTVVRKLLHEVVKLSAVPIDPNLPRPVITRPPPKVKQPPPPPKKRVGRRDIEMKKGDWLCSKCDFMNFAKNTVCLQCDAKRPKRELLPGEWECPECNFLNYRRNTVCFHCEHNRPPDTYAQNQFPEKRHTPGMRMDKTPHRTEVSDAWNFDFDDNESDGADVASFEYADSHKLDDDFPLNRQTLENSRGHKDDVPTNRRSPNFSEREYSDTVTKPSTGFNDFDDDEDDLDSYEVVSQNEVPKPSQVRFSELEDDSGSEDMQNNDNNWQKTSYPPRSKKSMRGKASFSDSEDEIDFNSDDDLPVHPKWKSSHVADKKQQRRGKAFASESFGSDSDLSEDENLRSKNKENKWGSNRMDRGRSHSVSYVTDSDEDFGYNRNKQRDKSSRDRPGKSSSGRGGNVGYTRGRSHSVSDHTDSDEDFGYNRNKQRDKGKASSGRGRGGNVGREKSSLKNGSSRSSGPGFKRNSREMQDDFDDRPKRNGRGKFQNHRQEGGSFDKRGGRSSSYDNRSDSLVDDERHLRPRNNVR